MLKKDPDASCGFFCHRTRPDRHASVLGWIRPLIDANLKDEEGSENFGPLLQDKGAKGKGPAADNLLAFFNSSTHPLCHGKATTLQTMRGWIQDCKEAADAEFKRRDKVEGPGRRDRSEDNIPEHIKIWCDLIVSWKEIAKATPKTDRYKKSD